MPALQRPEPAEIVPAPVPGGLGLVSVLNSDIQQRLVRTIHFVRHHQPQDEVQVARGQAPPANLTAQLLSCSQHVMSKQLTAFLANSTASTTARRLLQVASASLHCMSMQWAVLLSRAKTMIEERGFVGLVLGRMMSPRFGCGSRTQERLRAWVEGSQMPRSWARIQVAQQQKCSPASTGCLCC